MAAKRGGDVATIRYARSLSDWLEFPVMYIRRVDIRCFNVAGRRRSKTFIRHFRPFQNTVTISVYGYRFFG